MAKNRSRRDDNLRRQLALAAAKLMAEEGVADFAAAKLKAARQAGLGDARLLPDNREIEEALRSYQGLYQSGDQPAELRRLRQVAVEAMRELATFRPALVGAVLNGTANQYSDVTLQLFPDDPKAVALFLLNRRIPFEQSEKRVRAGDEWLSVPQFFIDVDGVPVTLSVYQPAQEHRHRKGRGEGDGPARARLGDVESLLRG